MRVHVSCKIRKAALDFRFANRREFRAHQEFPLLTHKSTNCSMAQACGGPDDGRFVSLSKQKRSSPVTMRNLPSLLVASFARGKQGKREERRVCTALFLHDTFATA